MGKPHARPIDPNRLYRIGYNETYGILAGLWDARQVLVKLLRENYLVLSFSRAGELEAVQLLPYTSPDPLKEQADIEQRITRDGPIRVKRFFLEDFGIGIQPLPSVLQEMLDDPNEYNDEEEESQSKDLRAWQDSGQFVLEWDNEYYLNESGHVVSS